MAVWDLQSQLNQDDHAIEEFKKKVMKKSAERNRIR
jgi:hypothetical protein